MSHSYNQRMAVFASPRLGNLLACFTLNLAEEGEQALERASGLTGSATAALLALDEFLGGAHVARLADVLGLTHSGAVRLVTQLERDGLAERHEGADRRRVEVQLTVKGQRTAHAARAARDEIIAEATSGLTVDECQTLEVLLDKLVRALVANRVERRRAGRSGAWWCRTCDFVACGRHKSLCPAQMTAAQALTD
jgi:DNA-binding MarR family transcriptional regulator